MSRMEGGREGEEEEVEGANPRMNPPATPSAEEEDDEIGVEREVGGGFRLDFASQISPNETAATLRKRERAHPRGASRELCLKQVQTSALPAWMMAQLSLHGRWLAALGPQLAWPVLQAFAPSRLVADSVWLRLPSGKTQRQKCNHCAPGRSAHERTPSW